MKSILLHVHEDSGFEARLAAALDIARAFEGHITCLHATPYEDYLAADPFVATILPDDFSSKMEKLRIDLQKRIEERLHREGVSWDWIHLNEMAAPALVRFSILSDLVVISLASEGSNDRYDLRSLAAEASIGSRAPVLAMPEQLRSLDLEAPILIAWNGSPEAATATRTALPLLKHAPRVVLLQVDEKPAPYPRDLIARHLSRHGVHVEILQQRPIQDRIALTIAESAAEIGAGLVVMGAYGHSRLREALLGGVTRALLHNSPIPLLLAH